MALIKTSTINVTPDIDHLHGSLDSADFVICKAPEKLKVLLDKLQNKKDIHFISDGYWSMHDLVTELLNQYKPAEIFITTYALREFAVKQLINAIDRKQLLSVTLLIDYKAKARTPEVYQLASMNFNRIYLTSIHAKVTVIRSPAGSVTVVGSANWTSNPRIEAGVISLDNDTANFHINWIEKVMNNAEIFN
jgi:hypothetical protein